jgi:CBS domain-containing protein
LFSVAVATLPPEDTLSDASAEFSKYGFRSLPMVDKDRKLLGVVSQEDLLAMIQ